MLCRRKNVMSATGGRWHHICIVWDWAKWDLGAPGGRKTNSSSLERQEWFSGPKTMFFNGIGRATHVVAVMYLLKSK